jgi:hypothetical protein
MTTRPYLLSLLALSAACAHAAPPPPDVALRLNGVDAFMSAAYPEPDPFTQEATLSAWVRLDVLPSSSHHIFHVVGKSGFARDLDLHVEPDDLFHFYVATGAPHVAVSKTKVEVGKWYRLDATYKAKDAIVLYVNRVAESTVAIPGVTRNANDGPITVGENHAFPSRYFQGSIDNVALWSRAMSPAEITAARFPQGHEPGLVAAYALRGDANGIAGMGHNGELKGGARFEPPGSPPE